MSVSLPTPLAPGGGEAGVDAFASHVHAQTPRPATVAKGDPQRVRLAYSHVIASPYAVREQTTKVRGRERKGGDRGVTRATR